MSVRKIALVTGAAQGIGREIARRLASDGFDVAVNDLASAAPALAEVVAEIKEKGHVASSHVADVSVESQVKAMIEQVVDVHGGLDVMVANAGIAPWGSVLKGTSKAGFLGRPSPNAVDATHWDRVMAVNVRGTFLSYKYAGLQMVAQGRGGRIIGASSVSGKMGFCFLPAYSASKFAVMGLTQATAQELGKFNITVNAYAPGPLNSVLMKNLAEEGPEDTGMSAEEWTDKLRQTSPLGRFGELTDISDLVSFLASSQAKHITGQNVSRVLSLETCLNATQISVNGGSHCS